MGSFRLDLSSTTDEAAPLPAGVEGLTGPALLQNAQWFTGIRWIVVALLAISGTAGLLLDPAILARAGLRPPGPWPLWLAGILALLNIGVIRWIGRISTQMPCPWRRVAANIWFQIVTDLAVLTVLVYKVGSTSTVVASSYLFHIALACIFFGRRDSFLVALLSTVLYLCTVTAQCLGLIPCPGILTSAPPGAPDILAAAQFAVPSVFVWFVVWHLVSHLSDAIRKRDRDLDAANRRIMRADQEINMQMLRVTHDLKAPFSIIEGNIQVLKHLHWNETPEDVRQIITKIDERAGTLRARIGDILTLGSLRSSPSGDRTVKQLSLKSVLNSVVQDVHGLAAVRGVSVNTAVPDSTVYSDEGQLGILFSNLVVNAIVYSQAGGTVDIRVNEEPATLTVHVADHGIGISAAALPHIFEDFYRAKEASAFNPNSTGLGLAIVRQIARNLGLAIEVESEEGKGTTFKVSIPKTLQSL